MNEQPLPALTNESVHLTTEELRQYSADIRQSAEPDTFVEKHLQHCSDCRCRLQEEVFSEAVRRTLQQFKSTSTRYKRRLAITLPAIALASGLFGAAGFHLYESVRTPEVALATPELTIDSVQPLPTANQATSAVNGQAAGTDLTDAGSAAADRPAPVIVRPTGPLRVTFVESAGFCLRKLPKPIRNQVEHATDFTWLTTNNDWLVEHLYSRLNACDRVRILRAILCDAGYGELHATAEDPKWSDIEDLTRRFQVDWNEIAEESADQRVRLPMNGVAHHGETEKAILASLGSRRITLHIDSNDTQ